jgi:hypothetical protein
LSPCGIGGRVHCREALHRLALCRGEAPVRYRNIIVAIASGRINIADVGVGGTGKVPVSLPRRQILVDGIIVDLNIVRPECVYPFSAIERADVFSDDYIAGECRITLLITPEIIHDNAVSVCVSARCIWHKCLVVVAAIVIDQHVCIRFPAGRLGAVYRRIHRYARSLKELPVSIVHAGVSPNNIVGSIRSPKPTTPAVVHVAILYDNAIDIIRQYPVLRGK